MKCFKLKDVESFYQRNDNYKYVFDGQSKFSELTKLGLIPEDIDPSCSIIELYYNDNKVLETKFIRENVKLSDAKKECSIIFNPTDVEYRKLWDSSLLLISRFFRSNVEKMIVLFIDQTNARNFRSYVRDINKLKEKREWTDTSFKDMLRFIVSTKHTDEACNICNSYYCEKFYGKILRICSNPSHHDCVFEVDYDDIVLGRLSYYYSNFCILKFNDKKDGKNSTCIDFLKYGSESKIISYLKDYTFNPSNSINDEKDKYCGRGQYAPKPYIASKKEKSVWTNELWSELYGDGGFSGW